MARAKDVIAKAESELRTAEVNLETSKREHARAKARRGEALESIRGALGVAPDVPPAEVVRVAKERLRTLEGRLGGMVDELDQLVSGVDP